MGELIAAILGAGSRLLSALLGLYRYLRDRPDVRITFKTYQHRGEGTPNYYAELVNHGPRAVELARAGYSYGGRKLRVESHLLGLRTTRVARPFGDHRRGLPVELGYRQAAQAEVYPAMIVDLDTSRVALELYYEDWTGATYWARIPDGLRDLGERYRDDPDRPRKYIDAGGQPVMKRPSEAGDLERWPDEP